MIRILIAEDSPVVAGILKSLFEAEKDLEVVGTACDGAEAVSMAADLMPDLITMDVMMPKMDGVEATERIMEQTPTPIVIISSHVNDGEMRVTFRSLAAGALSVLEKPEDVFSPAFEPRRKAFIKTIRAMAGVKVVRRRNRDWATSTPAKQSWTLPSASDYRLIALGASTGGPQALHQILTALPADYPLPIVIAQHITRGFTKGMVDWMHEKCALTLKIADDGELARAGYVYFAPDGTDVSLIREGDSLCLAVSPVKPEGVLTPSVNALFHSVVTAAADRAICGLLTGMGVDGAEGLLKAHNRGGWTFAEAEESCVVYGMPQAAAQMGAVREVLPLSAISNHLLALAGSACTTT